MALIICPECGKEISDKAAACIHCGYPLPEQPPERAGLIDSYKVAIPAYEGAAPTKIPAIKVVREVTGMGLAEAKSLVEQPSYYVVVKDDLSLSQAKNIARKFRGIDVSAKIYRSSEPVPSVKPRNRDTVCCPKCGSTEYRESAGGFRLVTRFIVTRFIGSGKTVLTCSKCGHRWKSGT